MTGAASAQRQSDLALGACIETIVTAPLAGRFTYLVPDGVDAPRGAILEVPFGARAELALSLGEAPGGAPAQIAREKIRAVARRLPLPPDGIGGGCPRRACRS